MSCAFPTLCGMTYTNVRMRFVLVTSGLLLSVGVAAVAMIAVVGRQRDGSVLLPNGQTITPAGVQIEVNDRPLGIAVSPDRAQAALATARNFAPRGVHFIDLTTQTIAQTIAIGNSFVGLAFSADGNTLYVGGGADNDVKIFTRAAGGSWALAERLPIPSAAPSGLALSPGGDKLYVAL